ncbi:MAG: regulatory protein [Saprospiraceae bacterium]|jgi:regulatory protein
MQKICSVQDRCSSEIRTRLIEHGVYGDDLEQVLAELIVDNFLNEERFAKAYVSGKFKIKRWGKIKIRQGLKFRKISEYSIKKGMDEIDYDDYLSTITVLLEKKNANLRAKDKWDRLKKLTSYAQQKGYEYDIIKEAISEIEELRQ